MRRAEAILVVGAGGTAIHPSDRLFPDRWGYPVGPVTETRYADLSGAGHEMYELGYALRTSLEAIEHSGNEFPYRGQDAEAWAQIAALMLSIGESAIFAALALTETDAAWSNLAQSEGQDRLAAIRAAFVCEATQQYLLAMGHQLANLAFRVFLTSGPALEGLSGGLKRAAMVAMPWSDDRAGWIFHSAIDKLASEITGSRRKSTRLVKVAAGLYRDASWRQLNESRGQSFHRWREDLGGISRTPLNVLKNRDFVTGQAAIRGGSALREACRALHAASPTADGIALVPVITSEIVSSGPVHDYPA